MGIWNIKDDGVNSELRIALCFHLVSVHVNCVSSCKRNAKSAADLLDACASFEIKIVCCNYLTTISDCDGRKKDINC